MDTLSIFWGSALTFELSTNWHSKTRMGKQQIYLSHSSDKLKKFQHREHKTRLRIIWYTTSFFLLLFRSFFGKEDSYTIIAKVSNNEALDDSFWEKLTKNFVVSPIIV